MDRATEQSTDWGTVELADNPAWSAGRSYRQFGVGVALGVIAASILFTTGCPTRAERVWEKAYEAHYQDAYQEGLGIKPDIELTKARAEGTTKAKEALASATAWALYKPLAWWSLVAGFLFGVVAQFFVLARCRQRRELPLFLACAFVPAVRRSRAFSLLELAAKIGHERRTIEAVRQRKMDQIRAVQQLVTNKLMAVSSLDDLSQKRLLELAGKELDRIVAFAQRKTNGQRIDAVNGLSYVYCPKCAKRVKYSRHFADKSALCPNPCCGATITFPAATESAKTS